MGATGCRQRRCLAGVVRVDPAGDSKHLGFVIHDELPVDLVQQGVHEDAVGALAADVAIRCVVERQAPPTGGHQAGPAEARDPRRVEDRVDAQSKGTLALGPLRQDGIHSLLQRQHGRGRLHVHEVVGPIHAKGVGQAVGQDGRRATGGGQGPRLGHLRHPRPLQLACRPAGVHAHVGSHERGLLQAGAVAHLVADLQHLPLVRVHAPGLVQAEAEELVVKHLDSLYEGAMLAGVSVSHHITVLWLISVVDFVVPPSERHDLGTVNASEQGRL
mmetsp:Transcript_107036/g.332583  ORF Transcript_107036/g.332583 Transcript_107036/m.332583 type:complete len:273 (-) Transcript_107036:1078-1896(-)